MKLEEPVTPVIVGRSSSHFTRVVRVFAAEMAVPYSFQIVRDLMSGDPSDYAGNPALKLPALRNAGGVWFGALNICRELSRMSEGKLRVPWPEQLATPLLANAQELVVQAMATEVAWIMAKVAGDTAGNAHQSKMSKSLVNTMSWLESNAGAVFDALPGDRELSYLEVTLFCLVTHLEFREVLPTRSYSELRKFCEQFSTRASVRETAYRFDS